MAASPSEPPKLHKTVAEITDIVHDLKLNFDESQAPITDDNSLLARFLIKIEYIFQLDLQAKNSILGTKKGYWDYLYKCLAGKRNLHDGIRFVKGISEIQTSEGRGRAFIRFCLMHHCLADSLQQCCQNERTTRVWYGEASPLRKESQYSQLISALYELNEIEFELNPLGCELDVGWPTFARKSFDPYSWRVPSRAMSVSSFCSAVSTSVERDSFCKEHFKISSEDNIEPEEDYQSVAQALTDQNAALSQQFEQKKKDWAEEKTKLEEELLAAKKTIEQHKVEEKSAMEIDKANHSPNEKQIKLMEKGLSDAYKNAQTLLKAFQTKVTAVENKVHQLDKTNPILSDASVNGEELVPIPAPAVKEFLEDVSSIHFSAQDLILTQKGFLDKISNLVKATTDSVQLNAIDLKVSEKINEHQQQHSNFTLPELRDESTKSMIIQIQSLKEALQAAKEILEIKDLEITKLRTEVHGIKLRDGKGNGSLQERPEDGSKLSKQVGELLGQVKSLQEEKMNVRRILTDAESGRVALEGKHREMASKCKESETSIKQLNEKLRNTLRLVDVQGEQNSQLQEQLISTKKENSLLVNQMKTLNELLQDIEKKELEIETQVKEEHELEKKIDESQCAPVSSKEDDQPIVKKVAKTLSRLNCLIDERNELERQLKITKEMTAELSNKVVEQEQQLANVLSELSETQEFIDKLRNAFSKLQTNEAILRHELREKRHLLNKLKSQLESSRNQWKQAQQKNSDSESQWQSLREEFDTRRMKSLDENEGTGEKEEQTNSEELKGADGGLSLSNPDLLAGISLSPDESNPLSEEEDARDRRLKFLEQQCQKLFEKLLKSAKYGAALDSRLASLHEHFGSGDTEGSNISTPDEVENNDACEVESNAASEMSSELTKENEEPIVNTTADIVGHIVDKMIDEVVDHATKEDGRGDNIETQISEVADENSITSSPAKASTFEMAQALPKRIEKLRKDKEEVQNKMKKVQGEKMAWEAKEVNYKAQIELLRTERDDLLRQLETSKSGNFKDNRVLNIKEQFQSKLLSIEQQLEERTVKMAQVQEELESTKKFSEQEISTLQFQLNTETLRYEQLLNERNGQEETMKKMQECINKQDVTICHFEEKLKSIEDERESEQAEQWRQLSELKQALLSKDEDSAKTVLSSITLLEEEHARSEKFRAEAEELNSTVAQLQVQVSQLETDNDQMKQLIVKLTKEKDELWKENFENTRADSQLVNPADVNQCTKCKVDFGYGVLLRKHHCRECGQIFCYQCANHWMLIPDSKENVRLCDDCFAKHNTPEEDNQMPLLCDDLQENRTDEASGSVTSSVADIHAISTEDEAPKPEEFHVITDQELNESLTTSSSSFSLSDNQENLILNQVWTEEDVRNTTEPTKILRIGPRKKLAIPVYIKKAGDGILKWSFTSKPNCIGFSVIFHTSMEDIFSSANEVLLSEMRVESHKHEVAGQLVPKRSGCYTLIFDNTFSKLTPKHVTLFVTYDCVSA